MPLTPLFLLYFLLYHLHLSCYGTIRNFKKMKNLVEEYNMCTCYVIMHVTV